MSEYRNVSSHAQPLASGRLVAPGDTCNPDLQTGHDQALVQDGALTAVEDSIDYGALRVEQLQAIADGAALDVKGTGKDGTVVKDDLVKALTAHDTTKKGV
jgi:hypothetical protein